ncbi:MAG: M20 family metallopeptidase [Kofleriaceae bacterium]
MNHLVEHADLAVRERARALIDLRRELHREPELAFAETRTAERVASRLEASGLGVRRGVAGTGVIAHLQGARPGPIVAWRADLDALPIEEPRGLPFASEIRGVMHACGHDGHAAIGVTVAEVLAAHRGELAGSVVFLFQPAEEVFGGAARMITEGALTAPSVESVYGLHLTTHLPPGVVSIGPGVMWAAADLFEIELIGRGAHGAYPHLGRNPLLAAANLVTALQGLVAQTVAASDTAVLSIGYLRGGERPNVIPERAVLGGSLRTLSEDARATLKARIEGASRALADSHEVRARVTFTSSCPSVRNDPARAETARRCARAVLGAAAVAPGQPSLASDDVAVFLEARPGCYFRAGIGPDAGPASAHHSPEFVMNEAGLMPAARVALRILLDATGSAHAVET